MSYRRPSSSYTAEDLVKTLPGWKPAPAAAAAEGEEPVDQLAQTMKEPILPDFGTTNKFNFITKTATDSVRQQ